MREKGKYTNRSHGHTTAIKDLFSVYRNRLQTPPKFVVQEFVGVVQEVVGVSVAASQCRYNPHTKTIAVGGSGMVRHEILLRAPEILTHLKKRLGEKGCPDAIV